MRAALYHRVSTGDQNPELARGELRQAAKHRGYEVALEIEETGSGARNDRPGFMLFMEAAKRRRIDIIICWKLDRFGRSALDVLANVNTLRTHGCALLFSSQGLYIGESADAMTLAMLQMMAAFAELERGIIRERTILGVRAAQARGVHCGRPGVVLPDPAAVTAAQEEKLGIRLIARRLGCSVWAVRSCLALMRETSAKALEELENTSPLALPLGEA